MHDVKIGPDHPVVAWIGKYVGQIFCRTSRDLNGRTPYERRFGRSFRKELPRCTECVSLLPYKRDSAKQGVASPKILDGIFWVSQRSQTSF